MVGVVFSEEATGFVTVVVERSQEAGDLVPVGWEVSHLPVIVLFQLNPSVVAVLVHDLLDCICNDLLDAFHGDCVQFPAVFAKLATVVRCS